MAVRRAAPRGASLRESEYEVWRRLSAHWKRRAERRARRGPSEEPTAAYAVVREDRRRASTKSGDVYRPGDGLVGVEDPDDGHIPLRRRVHHDAGAWMVGVRRVHDHGLGRRRWRDQHLPQREQRDDGNGEGASEGQPRMGQGPAPLPSLTNGLDRALSFALDAPHDARPEARPVSGDRGGDGLAERAVKPSQRLEFTPTACTRLDVDGHRTGRPLIEGSVEVGAEAPPRAVTGQHVDWTGAWPPIILFAV